MNNVEFNPGELPIGNGDTNMRTPLVVKILMGMKVAKTPAQATYIALFVFLGIIGLSVLLINSVLDKGGEMSSHTGSLEEVSIIGQIPGQI